MKCEFQFLPHTLTFSTEITPFNRFSYGLPHLVKKISFLPHLAKVLPAIFYPI